MVKTPKTRDSRPRRDPVTIELAPDAVTRVDEPGASVEPTTSSPKEKTVILDKPDAETLADGVADAPAGEAAPLGTNDASGDTIKPKPAATTEEAKKPFDYDFEADDMKTARPTSSASFDSKPAKPSAGTERSSMSLIAAGLIGGVVALAGGGLLQFAGLIGAPGNGGTAGLDGVSAEIAALKSEIATVKEGSAAGDASGRIDGLTQALEQVKADIASLQQAVQAGGTGENAGVAALASKVQAIETAIAGLRQAAGGADPAMIAAINEKIAGLDALVKAAGDAGSVVDGRLGALEQSLASLTAKVEAQAGQPKIAMAIAAAALKSAVERGVPFEAEIETFAAVAPDAPEIAALRAYAQNGVPTRAEIIAGIDAVADAMIAAANPPKKDAGFFERLLASAESLVTVRPIGAVEGAGVPETVARMEVAIKTGNLDSAIAEFDTLPEAAKTAGADFAAKLRARLDVEVLVDRAVSTAMKA